MEPTSDFSDKSWYKREGQAQSIYTRRTSVSSSTARSTFTVASQSPPTSRTGSIGSEKSSSSKSMDKKLPAPPPPPPPPALHPNSQKISGNGNGTSSSSSQKTKIKEKSTSTPTSVVSIPKSTPPPPPPPPASTKSKTKSTSKHENKPKPKPISISSIHAALGGRESGYEEVGLSALPTLSAHQHHHHHHQPTAPTSPPSSFSGSSGFSKDSMEKSLIPKRPLPVPSKPNAKARAKVNAKLGGGEKKKSRGDNVRIYVDSELGPKGSWYFPDGTAPGSKRKPKAKAKAKATAKEGQSGLVKSWFRALIMRRRVKLDA